MTFTQKLNKAIRQTNSCLCVGLDPNLQRIPSPLKRPHQQADKRVITFLKSVIDLTAEHCAAYKPNLGFFEALGAPGLKVFKEVIDYIPEDKIVIADGKRGDISSTAEHYANAYFKQFDVDAVTLNPLMGFDTLAPFSDHPDKGLYVLALTSNEGARDFLAHPFAGQPSMAAYIADKLAAYNEKVKVHAGMVIGATQSNDIKTVIRHHPKASLLIPGIGAQGGDIRALAEALENHSGIPLINSSRTILYAGEQSDHPWRRAVAEQAHKYKKALQQITQQYV